LIFEPYSSSKHRGILSYFNKEFIKKGIFPVEMGRSINKAFELRQAGDYREYMLLTYDDVTPFIDKAKDFLERIRKHLEENTFKTP
jgi:uncharacterized protein (UPF0332 family)